MAAMVNMTSLLNGKDSRWLQLEVCREFQRNKCSRQDTECKFAHPPANVEVQNGKVTACYDSIKGRCNRDKPPCKYFHPPQHLKDQLLINGRNHLALKNALMQQMGIAPGQPVIPGQVPAVATNPYLTGIPANTYSPYFAPGHLVPALLGPDPSAVSQLGPVVPQAVQVAQQKIPRSDRLEVCREFLRGACKRAESECRFAHPQDTVARHDDGSITVCMDAVKGRCTRDPCRYFHPPLHLQAQLKAAHSRATAVAAAAANAPVSVSAATLSHHHQQQQQLQQQLQQHHLQQPPPQHQQQTTTTTNTLNGSALMATHQQQSLQQHQQQQQQQQQQQHHQQPTMASAAAAAAAANAAAVAAMSLGQQHTLEVGKKRAADTDMFQLMDVKAVGSFYYENFAYSGMVPIKRPAAEKSGIPVYPGATTYQQLMQLQQPFVPVSCYSKIDR
ncbi:splicing regulator muscleblind isoform X11 [Musca autumnalis]|uniref:splicing regulator muscleblind isoform X11 n=1 Tax=Musca autumnalis TaxID=221902 RepID=UPI003CF554A8